MKFLNLTSAKCNPSLQVPFFVTLAGLLLCESAVAQGSRVCAPSIPGAAAIYVDSLSNPVTIVALDGSVIEAAPNYQLCPGDILQTTPRSRAAIRFEQKRTIIRLDGGSRVRILASGVGEADVSLLSGVLYFISSVKEFFRVDTPYLQAGIEGTEALVEANAAKNASMALVVQGVVTAQATSGARSVKIGQSEAAFASATEPLASSRRKDIPEAFRSLRIVSDDAVDWAIYYPPILFAGDAPSNPVARAVAQLASGDHEGAQTALGDSGAPGRDEAARNALLAIIAVARNQRDAALRYSDAAVAAETDFAPAHVSRSYALQATGDLGEAVAAAERAVVLAPDDPYALARLAELQLTVGERVAAQESGEASASAGRTAYGSTVLGLALLANLDFNRAQAYFEEAIRLDSEAPLPRLGLGLSKIRRGNLEAGSWEIERALAHDPTRASIRTMLARAYYDEGETEKAGDFLALAKSEDPNDPTPNLFSAIKLFAENRPIEALRQLEGAQDRSGARRVLRSTGGLDEDRATRGAALGRAFDVLGFDQLAIVEGAAATDADPSNPGAHRFLADVFRAKPRARAAQTSELLRSQLLSPPSKTPVQPQLAEADLALLDTAGPARVTFAEFSPLFDGDGLRFDASGLAGTQQTFGVESSITGLSGNFSLGLGQFHYETDGFHANNDVRHDVFAVMSTVSAAPWLDLFAEYRHRDSDSGDRRVLFDVDNDFNATTRFDLQRDIFRIGFHAMPSGSQDVLGLLSYGDLNTANEEDVFPFTSRASTDEEIIEAQAQYIGHFGSAVAQIGGSLSSVDGVENTQLFFGDFPLGPPFSETLDATQANLYGYATFNWPPQVEWTLGLSFDHLNEDDGDTLNELNPKVGARLKLTDDVTLRAGYYRTLKRRLVSDQTLEPTTVAGFVQNLDTFNGTVTDRIGLGVDARLTDALWIGAEATYGWLDLPGSTDDDATELTLLGYLNATIGDDIAIAVTPTYEQSESDNLFDIDELETFSLPMRVGYFDRNGLFASIEGTFVAQDGEEDGASFDDQFFMLNAAVGFRFAGQRGVVSIEGQNLLDSDFGYVQRLTSSDFTAETNYSRERAVFARLTLNF